MPKAPRMSTDRKSGQIPQSIINVNRESLGHFDDKYLYESLVRYGRHFGAGIGSNDSKDSEPTIIIDIRINSPIQFQVLSGDDNARGIGYQTVSKMKL